MTYSRHWSLQELQSLYDSPLLELVRCAHEVTRENHPLWQIQVCQVISVKTGGCPEDCKYCGQSSHYRTGVPPQPMMTLEELRCKAKESIRQGTTRICLSVAWRQVRQGKVFDQVLEMVSELKAMGVEVCCTLGMLEAEHAQQLKEAGLTSYNHNLDTSEAFYPFIIQTHTYRDRIETLNCVQQAGLGVCCGGIFGLGESVDDRLELIRTLANRHPQPHSVPLNQLVRIAGTPLEKNEPVPFWEFLPLVAIARIALPRAMIRLSGGRLHLSTEQQALCFMAGANSIHSGEKLLVTPSPNFASDRAMFKLLGLTYRPPFQQEALRELSSH